MPRAMTADDLYAIHWIGECDISPDGERVAFTVTRLDREADESRSTIWVVDAGGGEPRPFTSGPKDSAPRWSPDGRTLAFLRKPGDDPAQIFLMAADGGEARQLTRLPLGVGAPAWSPDGARIACSARTGDPPPPKESKQARPFRRIDSVKYRLNGEGFIYDRRRHLFVVRVSDGEAQQVTSGDWDDTEPAWSPNGRTLAFVSARQRTREHDNLNQLWLVPASGGRTRLLADAEGGGGPPAWSPDGGRIAQSFAPPGPANATLRVVEVRGGRAEPLDARFDRHTHLEGGPRWLDDRRVASLAEDRGAVAVVVAQRRRPTRWLAPGRHTLSALSVAADGRTAAVVVSSVREPAEVHRLDLQTGELTRLTHLNREWRREVATQPAQRFTVRTAPGVEVDAWFMKPHGFREGRRYPVLLNIHGGPFTQYGETFFDEFQVYAGAGYGVVFCNPRGSSGQGTEFGRAIVGDMGGPDYHDVMAAFDAALRCMPWADTARLGVLGGSYGGFMTSWVVGHTRRFAAACSERAVNDWYVFFGTSDIGATFTQRYLGERATPYDDVEAVLRQSPSTYVRDIRTPLLILHSEDDLRCPISQAEALFVPLRKLRRDVEFVRVPDENHELSRGGRPSHRFDRFGVILDYFGRKLARGGRRRGRSPRRATARVTAAAAAAATTRGAR